MKKYLFLIISLIFITSIIACKSTEDPKPLTLAERAGTYIDISSGAKVIVAVNGSITFTVAGTKNFDPTSTEIRFDFDANRYIVFLSANSLTYTSADITVTCTK